MTHRIENLTTMAKGFAIFLSGAVTWIATNINAMLNPPNSDWMVWLDKYGFPTVVSILFLVGIVVIFKAYCNARDQTSAVQESRIADRDATIEQYRADFTEAQTMRVELVNTNRQTVDMLGQVKDELKAMQGFKITRRATKPAKPYATTDTPEQSPQPQ